ncbi:MAG: hypothetical protein R3C43_09645 [Chloroflexota bacterium]
MTIFIVDESGQGDYKTIGAALQAAKLGDTIRVLNGVYRERVNIGVPKIVLEAADGHTPEIDGGWNGKTVESGFAAQVQVQAPGVLVRGLTIRNCPGRGLGVTADNVTVRGCRIDNTYQGALYVGPGTKDDKSEESDGPAVRGILVEGCIMSRMSQSWVTETRPKGVNGGINFHTVEDGEFRNNFASDGWGEIFNLGRGSKRVRVVGNIFHSGNHVLGYLNRCQECEFIGNILFHVPDAAYRNRDGEWSAGFVIGDERGRAVKDSPFSWGNVIRENVVVNTGVLLHVRNNTKETGGMTRSSSTPSLRTTHWLAGRRRGQGSSSSRTCAGANMPAACSAITSSTARPRRMEPTSGRSPMGWGSSSSVMRGRLGRRRRCSLRMTCTVCS